MNNSIMNIKIILLFLTNVAALDKLCINCKHFKKDIFTPSKYAQCKKFLIIDKNVNYLIDGERKEETTNMYYCSTARTFDNLCGEDGTAYEPKRVPK
jgi:hypothetical protein